MPELPEVETVRRILHERLAGRRITAFAVGRPTFYRLPPASALKTLIGESIKGFSRRGKYLIMEFSSGRDLVLHLGMSGRVTLNSSGPHVRFQFETGNDTVFFHDARRFGRVGCALPKLGPEPGAADGFDAHYLRTILRGRTGPVKALLMDQKLVAGLGNIYATEALFAAGIRPGRAGGSLTCDETERLVKSCIDVLRRGVELGGSTLNDESFLDPLGRPGRNQDYVSVYGRKMGSCGHALKATRKPIGGRTSLYCPNCQK